MEHFSNLNIICNVLLNMKNQGYYYFLKFYKVTMLGKWARSSGRSIVSHPVYIMEHSSKQGSIGINIRYSCIKMADYLLPNEDNLSISDQRYVFSIRNRIVPILYSFPEKQSQISCLCGQTENMKHIYSCKYLNI